MEVRSKREARVVGRYALYDQIASGGMAAVHLGRLIGPVGFSRSVAIKRLHAQYAADPDFVSMFLDEARLAARIRHPNVVPTLDVVAIDRELFIVMDYVLGESLARIQRSMFENDTRVPVRIAAAILIGTLHGLQAAHDAQDEKGVRLQIVHRDVSPQNILVGTDGIARVLDFGIAKARGRHHETRDGQIKGKLSYMAPEQLRGEGATHRTDLYAASVVFWEMVTGRRLFYAENEAETLTRILIHAVERPSSGTQRLDDVIMRGLAREPTMRFQSAREMADEIERSCPIASTSEVGDWIRQVASGAIAYQARLLAEVEGSAGLTLTSSNQAATTSSPLSDNEATSAIAPTTHALQQKARPHRVAYLVGIAAAVGFLSALLLTVPLRGRRPDPVTLAASTQAQAHAPHAQASATGEPAPTEAPPAGSSSNAAASAVAASKPAPPVPVARTAAPPRKPVRPTGTATSGATPATTPKVDPLEGRD